MWDFLQAVAFGPVRELIGLDQCEYAITGAAPIPAMLIEWFNALGVPLSEVYGLSETTGPMTLTVRRIKAGSVGPAIPGCEVALADDGEIICRGGNVFPGYLDDPERTAEAIDAEGWFHSGDIGQVDDDGYYTVVDRKKELIITAGGKNISPANLEAALKTIPIVGPGLRHRRQQALRRRPARARSRGGAGVGPAARHRVRGHRRPGRRTPRCGPRSIGASRRR